MDIGYIGYIGYIYICIATCMVMLHHYLVKKLRSVGDSQVVMMVFDQHSCVRCIDGDEWCPFEKVLVRQL